MGNNPMTRSFNFDELHNRRNNNSEKWTRYSDEVLPLWVADMDFKAAPEIIEGLVKVSQNGIFGYSKDRPKRVIDAIVYRMQKLYGWQIEEEAIVLLPGLVTGFNIAGNLIKRQHDEANYIAMTPVYPPFLQMAKNQGLVCKEVPLKKEVDDNIMRFSLDEEALRHEIDENTKLLMLCHPHNPVGHIFTERELKTIEKIASLHNLVVVSDEIHAELLLEDKSLYPYALVSKASRNHTITLFAPSKTFNIPGLAGGFAIIENPKLRQAYCEAMQGLVPDPNIYGLKGIELAFDYGDEWLMAVLAYLKENRDYLARELAKIPGLCYTLPEATFLMWLDFSETKLKDYAYETLLENNLALNDGRLFGASGSFVRLNFATPRLRLQRAITMLHTLFDL